LVGPDSSPFWYLVSIFSKKEVAFMVDEQIPAHVTYTKHQGRPLGLPHKRDQQMAVIRTALRLLEKADHAPTVEVFS